MERALRGGRREEWKEGGREGEREGGRERGRERRREGGMKGGRDERSVTHPSVPSSPTCGRLPGRLALLPVGQPV